MVTYDRETGLAYSDATNFADWHDELSAARLHWFEFVLADKAPAWVLRKARSGNNWKVKEATLWLKQNGWVWAGDPERGHWIIQHKGILVSEFKICFQPPDKAKCRICGEGLPPGYKQDSHEKCNVVEYLKNKIWKQSTIQGATLN